MGTRLLLDLTAGSGPLVTVPQDYTAAVLRRTVYLNDDWLQCNVAVE